jgi:hypothetical protein
MFDKKKKFSSIESFEKNVVPNYFFSKYHNEEENFEKTPSGKNKKFFTLFDN